LSLWLSKKLLRRARRPAPYMGSNLKKNDQVEKGGDYEEKRGGQKAGRGGKKLPGRTHKLSHDNSQSVRKWKVEGTNVTNLLASA